MLKRGEGERYAFLVDYKDATAQATFRYQLFYHPADSSVEMYDPRNRRPFLKRVHYPHLRQEELYPGNVITIFSRKLSVHDYADERTRAALAKVQQRALVLVTPEGFNQSGSILTLLVDEGFSIAALRSLALTSQEAGKLNLEGEVRAECTKGPCLAIEVLGEDAFKRLQGVVGPSSPQPEAAKEAPGSINARIGRKGNAPIAILTTDDGNQASHHISTVHSIATSAERQGCALGIVKPHAVKSGDAWRIIQRAQQPDSALRVTAIQSFLLARADAAEFLEVYKGVVPEYAGMVDELTAGLCVALEVTADTGKQEDSVEALRSLCGPAEPEIAQVLRPESLRAKHGRDKVHNAIHCTDLEEDGELESNYFFGILQEAS